MATKNSSGGIKAIDATSVHRITSGQVVIDLQTAVKELVENSLDAGATSIEVRFKNYGLKTIEIVDNGSGISEADHDSIGRKHHTSKLSSFHHLTTLTSFGFRGEALSSLCALCDSITVTTATAETAPMGAIIELDKAGEMKKREKAVRQRGTTVLLTSPFVPLPVRRKELERNIKREFGKALTLLNAYALGPCCGLGSSDTTTDGSVTKGRAVRFIVTNQPEKGSKVTHISLPLPSPSGAAPSICAGAIALWGPKALDNVIELKQEFHVPRIMAKNMKQKSSQPEQEDTFLIRVTGLISSPTPVPGSGSRSNLGRSGSDRQFFYVNGRPCALNKIQKMINETYRSFSPSNSGVSQYPFVVADFTVPGDAIDVNVTPDKRTILLHAETQIIDRFKSALEDLFVPTCSTYGVNGASQNNKSASMPQSRATEGISKLARSVSMKPALSDRKGYEHSDADAEVMDEDGEHVVQRILQGAVDRGRQTVGQPANRSRSQSTACSIPSTVHSRVLSHPNVAEDRNDSPSSQQKRTLRDDRSSAPEDQDITMAVDDDSDLNIRRSPSVDTAHSEGRSGSSSDTLPSSLSRPSVYPSVIRKPLTEKPAVVLNTGSAIWNRKQKGSNTGNAQEETRRKSCDDEAEREPPRKKRKSSVSTDRVADENEETDQGDDGLLAKDDTVPARDFPIATHISTTKVIRQTKLTEAFKLKTPREELRSRLVGFARSGSQLRHEPENDEEGDTDEEKSQLDTRQSEGPRTSRRDEEVTEGTIQSLFLPENDNTEDSMLIDLDDEPTSSSVVTFNSFSSEVPASTSGLGTSVDSASSSEIVDLTLDDRSDDVSLVSAQAGSSQSRNDPIDRPEVIRTSSQTSGNVHLRVDLSAISERWSRLHDRLRAVNAKSIDPSANADTFAKSSLVADAGVSNIDAQASAEAALSRTFDKKDFGEMEVIGQFNLGFIIARRRKGRIDENSQEEDDTEMEEPFACNKYAFDDLFIVDQHAADEKYNFESLQQTTRIESQKLFKPQPLELTAADELVALENLVILERNGFEIEVQEDDDVGPSEVDADEEREQIPSRQKLKLVAQPVSKATVFGMRDLEELIQLMHDRPSGQMVRCSKARAMFAMRACRKSVMVGMPLTKSQMTVVVQHMGTMDQPWNCPHGRPTMRHLCDLSKMASKTTGPSRHQDIDWSTFNQ